MLQCFTTASDNIVAIEPICQDYFTKWLTTQTDFVKNVTTANNFVAEPNTVCLLPQQNGKLAKVLLGIKSADDFLAFGCLPKMLPAGCYYINAPNFSPTQLEHAAIGWGMGSYQFANYKKPQKIQAQLSQKNYDKIANIVSSIFWVRDLINTPASDLNPEKLATVAENLAKEFKANFQVTSGEELRKNFPAVHAVGCGSKQSPLLIDLQFGDSNAPKVVLVGKGVCFDSGGLQLKSSDGMLLMKKDMGGAAHALGLARMIMLEKLPINLRVIIPAVENLPSGSSLKPGDIITTRKGLTLEVANTDAEGRLILADALTLAAEWQPQLILDFATLTMAARVALGTDIAALFTPNDQLATKIMAAMAAEQEPVWRMPLYQPYLELLQSENADYKNVTTTTPPTGGAIIAALILQQFVPAKIPWAHFDINAYNDQAKPGKPIGGEAECIRGVFAYLHSYLYTTK